MRNNQAQSKIYIKKKAQKDAQHKMVKHIHQKVLVKNLIAKI